ncbi:ATP-binding cassette domain-containing protein [Lactobacillus sp. R2/2]|nr:ATP-binding cassette domain-containing protein [Lactobacillus sp. R2/2]
MGNRSQLFPDLTPRDYLELLQTMYDIPESVFAKTVTNLARILNVTEKLDLQTRKLSLGERMKIEFLAGVATRPKVLFLDEPTIGLDVIAKGIFASF